MIGVLCPVILCLIPISRVTGKLTEIKSFKNTTLLERTILVSSKFVVFQRDLKIYSKDLF